MTTHEGVRSPPWRAELTLVLAALLMVVAAASFAVQRSAAHDQRVEAAALKRSVQELETLRGYVGYGGMVHAFKNHLLRPGEGYGARARAQGDAALAVLDGMANEGADDERRQAIATLRRSVGQYMANVALVDTLRSIGRTVAEIDASVRIDDAPAMSAFDTLETHIAERATALATAQQSRSQRSQVATLAAVLSGLLLVGLQATTAVWGTRAEARGRRWREADTHHARLVRDASDAILTFDDQFRVVEANRAAESMFGSTEGALAGRALDELFGSTLQARHGGALLAILHGDKASEAIAKIRSDWHAVLAQTPDGSQIPTMVSLSRTRIHGSWHLSAVITDMSEVVRREEQADRVEAELTQLAEQRRRFLGQVSHELRTPLTAILALADLLAQDLGDHPSQDRVQLLRRTGRSLDRIVGDLLELTRIQGGRLVVQRVAMLPIEVTAHLRSFFEARLDTSGTELIVEPGVGVDQPVACDPVRLRQIAFNLVGNAVRHAPGSQVRVQLDCTERAEGLRTLHLRVADNGPGIPASELDAIFAPYWTTSESSSYGTVGLGLGLAIARGLARELGGDLQVDSVDGVGTSFHLTVPVAISDASPLVDAQADEIGAANEPVRILLADDVAVNRMLLAELLGRMGHDVETADSGRTTLQLAATRPFDLLALDFHMPDMNGDEVLRQLRQEPGPNQFTPAIALTADGMPERNATCLEAGFEDVVLKPLSPGKLHRVIRSAIAAEASSQRKTGDGQR